MTVSGDVLCSFLANLTFNQFSSAFVSWFSDSNKKKKIKTPTIIAEKVKLLCLWLKLQNICTDKTNIFNCIYRALMQTRCWSLNVPAE